MSDYPKIGSKFMYGVLRSAARLGANRDKKPHLPNSTAQGQTSRRENTAAHAKIKIYNFGGQRKSFLHAALDWESPVLPSEKSI